MKEAMELLGLFVEDKVTNFSGVVTSVSFDLYGCIQAVVTPKLNEGKLEDGRWFDVKRLTIVNDKPVMEVPTFEDVPGGQVLPPQNRY